MIMLPHVSTCFFASYTPAAPELQLDPESSGLLGIWALRTRFQVPQLDALSLPFFGWEGLRKSITEKRNGFPY